MCEKCKRPNTLLKDGVCVNQTRCAKVRREQLRRDIELVQRTQEMLRGRGYIHLPDHLDDVVADLVGAQ